MTTYVPRSISQQHLDSLPMIMRVNLLSLVERLEGYKEKMRPGMPVDPRDGVKQQAVLWTAIRWTFDRPIQEFVLLYGELLLFVHEHRTGPEAVFDERYIYRFFDQIKLGVGERRNFERALHLLMTTANPATRKVAYAQTDIRHITKDMRDEPLTEKLIAFYETV